MRVHDYHLSGYEVRKFGGEIVLHLDLADADQSRIKFSDVAAYHFVHTGGSIIFDIEEIPIGSLLENVGDEMVRWSRQHGGYGWLTENRERYRSSLEADGYKAWSITSSVGFGGFVIAKSVAQVG